MGDVSGDGTEDFDSPTLVSPGASADAPVSLDAPSLESLAARERYELGTTLGRGGMGEIRAVVDVALNRHQAMKLTFAQSPAARARFVREARVQGQLEHPGVVPVYELGLRSGGDPYFTMKRVRGVTLEEVLKRLRDGDVATEAKYPRRRLLAAFQSVCLTVDFAHARRVIHRDLKPANIMLGDFGEVYVLDWGIAKHLSEPTTGEVPTVTRDADEDKTASGESTPAPDAGTIHGKTAAGAVMGTPGYMAPEQAAGQRADERSDVWSLGAIFFELLTGQRLVPGHTVEALLERTRAGVDARPRARAPERDLPPELEAIAVKATATERRDRYSSARALHDAVDAFLAGERDVQLRAELAERHVATAEARAAAAVTDGGDAATLRAEAFRELGKAIALEPANPRALRTLVRLLGTAKGALPEGARAELEAGDSRRMRSAGQLSAAAYSSLFLYLPMLLWMGVRDLQLLVLMYASVLLAVASALWVGLAPRPRPVWGFVPFVGSTVMIWSLSFILGPFIFLPSFAATNTAAFALLLERRFRPAVYALGAASVLAPLLAELAGVLPSAMHFSDAGLTLSPQMLHLPAVPTMVVLSIASVATIGLSAFAVAQLRDALRQAEERLSAQAWNLRQLLPPEATAATTGEIPVVGGEPDAPTASPRS